MSDDDPDVDLTTHTPSTEWLVEMTHDSPAVVVPHDGNRFFRVTVEEVTTDR
jgi:hypothetical protein